MPLIDLEERDLLRLPTVGAQPRERAVRCARCHRPTLNVGAVCGRCVAAADIEERASAMAERLGLVVVL